MSDKSITVFVTDVIDEDTDAAVQMSITADYLNTGFAYLNIGNMTSIVIPAAQARAVADFILREIPEP